MTVSVPHYMLIVRVILTVTSNLALAFVRSASVLVSVKPYILLGRARAHRFVTFLRGFQTINYTLLTPLACPPHKCRAPWEAHAFVIRKCSSELRGARRGLRAGVVCDKGTHEVVHVLEGLVRTLAKVLEKSAQRLSETHSMKENKEGRMEDVQASWDVQRRQEERRGPCTRSSAQVDRKDHT